MAWAELLDFRVGGGGRLNLGRCEHTDKLRSEWAEYLVEVTSNVLNNDSEKLSGSLLLVAYLIHSAVSYVFG